MSSAWLAKRSLSCAAGLLQFLGAGGFAGLPEGGLGAGVTFLLD